MKRLVILVKKRPSPPSLLACGAVVVWKLIPERNWEDDWQDGSWNEGWMKRIGKCKRTKTGREIQRKMEWRDERDYQGKTKMEERSS